MKFPDMVTDSMSAAGDEPGDSDGMTAEGSEPGPDAVSESPSRGHTDRHTEPGPDAGVTWADRWKTAEKGGR